MELLTITLAANETKQFAKAGRYFEIIESNYVVQVDFTGPSGNLTDSMRNALSGLYLEDPYAAFAITNGATAQTVVVLLMEQGRGGSRRQPGVVQVVDSNKSRTVANQAFTVAASRGSPGVGQFARCGVSNAAGSGKRLIIEKVTYATNGAAATFYLGFKSAPAGLSSFANSKLAGGAASTISQVCSDNSPTQADLTQTLISLPGTVGQIQFNTPVVLMPGWSFVAAHSTANQDVFLTAEFSEEVIT